MAGNVYKRVNGAWVADKYYQYQQNAATVENSKMIPIYSDGSNLTDYSFEGQCSQALTPSPSSPVDVQEFGNQIPDIGSLNAIGEYIDSLNLATGLYSHKIKQIIFDGSENWTNAGIAGLSRMSIALSDVALVRDSVCSHYIYDPDNLNVNNHCFITSTLSTFIFCDNTNATDLTKWTTFLATQYANGTPLTVWYILATPTTETLTIGSGLSGIEEGYTIQTGTPTPSSPQMPQTNDIGGKTIIQITSAGQTQNVILSEPLRKIGDYADSVDSMGVVTRKIKKLILDGTEDWQKWRDSYIVNISSNYQFGAAALSTHYAWNATMPVANEQFTIVNEKVWIRDDSQSTLADFTTFLAQQYANGTPVTVYYVLATPITESYSKNLFTPAAAQTATLNGVTCVSDGEGRYSFNGTSSANTILEFDLIDEFTIPISVGQGGGGTFSFFNNFSIVGGYFRLELYYNDTLVENWAYNEDNRKTNSYVAMGGKKVNKIKFTISANKSFSEGSLTSPMFTDNGQYPTVFEPHTLPTIPTSSGFSNITIGTSLAPSKFTYNLGKMFVGKGQGKVRVNGEWV